jgi:TIR domain
MHFEFDVFVSYAHLDNTAVDEHQKGWVAKLHETLDRRLAQLLGKPTRIWRDPKLKGNDVFEEVLVDRVKRAAVLISVVSPRYVRSEWTIRELNEFWKAAEQQGGVEIRDKSRIFKVLKTPVPLDQQSPPLRSLLGYEFFRVDPENGSFREFDEQFGPEYQQKFLMKLDDLAQDLKDLLECVEGPEPVEAPADASGGDAIFLAVTTFDLQDERDAIRRDLQQHGYTVLPARALSSIGAEVERVVREDLARCSMSIHLIGNHYSLTPEDAMTSLVEIQNEVAIERGERGGFTRLVWIPPGLQITDPRQQQVIDRLRMDPRMGVGADLLEKPLDDLRAVIKDALERGRAPQTAPLASPAPSTAASTGVPSVYLVYDQCDTAAVSPWADFLYEQGLDVVHQVFEGDEAAVREGHEECLRTSDGVVIFDGAAHPLWLRRKFSELKKIPGYGRTKPSPVVAVCLLPPKTPDKERFRAHEATIIPQWDGLSPDPWQPIIARLKG